MWLGTSSICGSLMYAVQDQVQPDAPSLWCSSCTVCPRAGYTLRCDCTLVHLCASSLQTLQYHMTFNLLSVTLWNDLGDPVLDGVELAHFKSRANAILALLLAPFLSLCCFFSSLVLWVVIMGLGSSDWCDVNRSLHALHCQPFLIIIITAIKYETGTKLKKKHFVNIFFYLRQ